MSRKNRSIFQNKILFFILGFIIVIAIFVFRGSIYQFLQKELEPTSQISGISDTYVGTLPCADCSGLQTTLELHKNNMNDLSGTYTLKQVYLEKSVAPLTENGNWTIINETASLKDVTIYQLTSIQNQDISYYLVLDTDHIKLLDPQGNEIPSPLNFTLNRKR